jgi:hypothetical protein
MSLESKANDLKTLFHLGTSLEDVVKVLQEVQSAERARCKLIVQRHQYRNGYHEHEGTSMAHYDVAMFAAIDSGIEPKN